MSGEPERSPLPLHAYVLTVALAAATVMMVLPTDPRVDLILVSMLGLLAGIAGGRAVRIVALRTEVTATDAFVFCALGTLGPRQAATVALCGIFGAALARARWPTTIRLAFNCANVALSTAGAGLVFYLAGGVPGAPLFSLLGPLAVASVAYFLVNTALVSIVIAIERDRPVLATWRESGLWTGVSTLTAATLAAGLIAIVHTLGPWGLALGIPPCWLLSAFYRSHRAHLEEQSKRIELVEQLNTALEAKVGERTEALEAALRRLAATNGQLRDANRDLEAASEAKSEFLANVSHELRTPLNAVIGFSDLLFDREHGGLTRNQAEFVTDIKTSGEHLLHLINNILDLSKIEAGRLEVHLETLDLSAVLRETSAMLHPQANRKGLSLSVRCADDMVAAAVDPGMIREVLLNLLSNAVKFTEQGGVELEAWRTGDDLHVAVSDSGIGVPEADQARLFEEFYQVDSSYSRKYQGTGLGLALVKRLVELHGGSVELKSEPGVGSRFHCVFPAAVRAALPAPVAEIPDAVPVAREHDGARRVLVVEDNTLNRKLMRNALRARGYEVTEATSGEEALELLEDYRPDVVLLDIELPNLDGLELVRRLKADPVTAGLPLIAVSAHAHEADERRALAAGCTGYIRKPIRINSLAAEIEALCKQVAA